MTNQPNPPGAAPGQTRPAGAGAADGDPSMEDILASIRRILDDEAEPPAAESDVLDLTEQMLARDEPDAPVAPAAPPSPPTAGVTAAAPSAEPPPPEPRSAPAGAITADAAAVGAGVIGAAAAGAAAASFAALRAATSGSAAPVPARPETPLGQATLTLEELVRQEIRPLLRTWLDENLPPLVERLVKAELERIARG
ncbi:MAG: DUF2497 domain-containing protein [Acetobacteraceae bacterium]